MSRYQRIIGLGIAFLLSVSGSTVSGDPGVPPSDIAVVLMPYNPPISIPGSGGTFGFNLEVFNDTDASQACEAWTIFTLPGSRDTVAGYGPVTLTLPTTWSAQSDLLQSVPGDFPAGTYTYTAFLGIYPDEAGSSDSFVFEKLPGGVGWYAQSPGAEHALTGVVFVDTETGWAVSDYREIIHTTDGGDTWYHQDDGQYYPHEYNDVCFVDAQTGWVVGHGWSLGGTILQTTDGGDNWTLQEPDSDYEFNSVVFVDANTGWVAGGFFDIYGSNHRQVIDHTADGGATWEQQYLEFYHYPLQSIAFTDGSYGWAVGGPGYIVHTTDGGDHWYDQASGTSSYLHDVHFVDPNVGWCVGDGGTLLHTTDGGENWSPQNPGTTANLNSVFFLDVDTGWIAGVNFTNFRPIIRYTEDGGETWQPQDPSTGDDQIVLSDLYFVNGSQGWVAGLLWPGTGVLLHTEDGGVAVTWVGDDDSSPAARDAAQVSAPYPNPFNPSTRITFAVPAGRAQPVAIELFDVQGRLIRRLIGGVLEPGHHTVVWDGLDEHGELAASGVYFYRARIGTGSARGKLTLLR